MNCRMKPLYAYLSATILLLGCWSCGPSLDEPVSPPPENYQLAEGQTMGTYYRITYADSLGRNFQPAFDSLLQDLNRQVSTYIDSSTISRFNRAVDRFELSPADSHFIYNLDRARAVFERTGGAFDPTVAPLVNYWGFGYEEKKPVSRVDSSRIAVLMESVGMEKVRWAGASRAVLTKANPGVKLDFSAIAKGYGVDLLAQWLERRGVQHFLVDIGGELRARGRNPRARFWSVGINVPREGAPMDQLQATLTLENQAIATSGNYRNYYEVDGQKFSHTINPFTGFPERSSLLSASILAADCTTADAYATACMVVGVEEALALVESRTELEGYFIYSDEAGNMQVAYSQGFTALQIKE